MKSLLLAALLLGSSAAWADTPAADRATEDQLFGKPDDAAKPAQTPPPAPPPSDAQKKHDEEELFGSGPSTPKPAGPGDKPAAQPSGQSGDASELTPTDLKVFEDKTNANNDKLTIGGLAYILTQYNQNTIGTPTQDKTYLTSPDFVDVYLDGRPSDRLRVFVRGRLNYNPSMSGAAGEQPTNAGVIGTTSCISQQFCPQLDQLWMKFDAGQRVFFTVGRQRIKWGSGRFWNPTDFLNDQKLNALAILDQRLGVDLVKVHFPVESLGMNFYAIASIQDTTKPHDVGLALRGEFLIKQSEITATVAWRAHNPRRLGTDASFALGPFDMHAELAVLHPMETTEVTTYGGQLPDAFYHPDQINQLSDPAGAFISAFSNPPGRVDHLGEWKPQFVVGGEVQIPYNDDKNNVILGAEYFFNSLGYDNSNLYPLLFFSGQFTPLYTGKHYAAFYVSLPTPGHLVNTTFTVSTIGNLSDKSFVSRFDYRVTLLTYLQLGLFAQANYGANGEFHYGLNVAPYGDLVRTPVFSPLSPMAQMQLSANGLQIGAPVFSAGAVLIVNI
jgi:hypothetical protein